MDARAYAPYIARMLESLADDIWVASRPLRFFGLEVGTRMTVVRLAGGGLFLHSPVALDDETKKAVDALGPVVAIVAPTLFHHLHVAPWVAAYPDATVSGCPGMAKKRTDIAWTRTLGDEPAEEWKDSLEQVFFGALAMQNEVVFFHPKSKTMITSDVVFDLVSHPSMFTRAVSYAIGHWSTGPTLLERVMMGDRKVAKEQIGRMVAWNADRLILAHGNVIPSNGSKVLEKGYAWL